MRVGIDLVEIDRFRSIVHDNPAFLDRVLIDREKMGTDVTSLAGKFTAKEALYMWIYPPSQKTESVSSRMNAKNFLLRRDFAPDEAWGVDTPTVRSRELHKSGRLVDKGVDGIKTDFP